MLHVKSKTEDIAHYILQMELLLLSDKEKFQINQILALEKLTNDNAIKDLIQEDLKDEKWISDTNVLINTCYKKIEKSMIVENHIDLCRSFMVYRYMEGKCHTNKLEVFKQIGGWIFNEINTKNEKTRWVSQKFLQNFDLSSMPRTLASLMQDEPRIEINLQWLHIHREKFFTDEIFVDLNQKLKEGIERHSLIA